MLAEIYNKYSERIFLLASKIKVYQLILLTTLLTIICYFPDVEQYKSYGKLYHSIDKEINQPFQNASYTDESVPEFNMHTENRKFRLLIPAIGNLLHLNARQLIWLQFLLLPFFLLTMYYVFKKITQDHIIASLLTFALPFFYVTESFLWVMPIYDGYGYFLLALLFLTNNNFFRYLLLLAVCLSDERAIFSTTLVFISLQLYENKELLIRKIISFNKNTIVFILGWTTYIVYRLFLINYFGTTIPISGCSGIIFLKNNFGIAPLAIFLTFEGFWILVLSSIITLFYTKRHFEIILILSTLFVFFTINLMVFDITRSFGYCYTFIFIALLILQRNENKNMLKHLSLISMLACMIIPTMLLYSQNGRTSISWLSPIFPRILNYF